MRRGIYPGSFDPVTNGHLDIIKRAAGLCDQLIVAVAHNQEKKHLFTAQERETMLQECCDEDISNIKIVSFDGLLVEYCVKNDISFIVRGLRAIADYEYEYAIALMNKRLVPKVETVFLMASAEHSFISSRIAKEVATYDGDITSLVPPSVAPKLKSKLLVP